MNQNKLSDLRDWTLQLDMNGDGAFTVSDVFLCLKSLFFMPGDFVLSHMGKTLTSFFEITPEAFGGAASGVISFIIWIVLFSSLASKD